MKNSISVLKSLIQYTPAGRPIKFLFFHVFITTWINSTELQAAQPSGLQATSDSATGLSASFVILFIVCLILASVLVITALTRWSKKQDSIDSMMPFCIKYLVETRNGAEKCAAAKSLGQVKDPGALLILVDVINDEGAEESLRKTAGEALRSLSKIYRKYETIINDLLSAVEERNHQKSIDILISNFEHQRKLYVQSPYVIGREFMRLKKYAEAREWLQKAKIRNNKTVVYVHQISELIDTCNEKLFTEGDVLFQVGDYYNALERYALASHDLRFTEKQRFVSHLRLACVYSKLTHYEDAYQETLHALHDHHETDTSLRLNKLLKNHLDEITGTPKEKEKRKKILDQIDKYVTDVMIRLTARHPINEENAN